MSLVMCCDCYSSFHSGISKCLKPRAHEAWCCLLSTGASSELTALGWVFCFHLWRGDTQQNKLPLRRLELQPDQPKKNCSAFKAIWALLRFPFSSFHSHLSFHFIREKTFLTIWIMPFRILKKTHIPQSKGKIMLQSSNQPSLLIPSVYSPWKCSRIG